MKQHDAIRNALVCEDAGALLLVAAEEARRRDRFAAYQVLLHLGQVAKVEFRDGAGSARIGLRHGRPTVEIAPQFVERFVRTPADLLHLLLHELLHSVRGDLRRPRPAGLDEPAWRALRNLAADMLVNADLHETVLGGTPGYFRALYPRDSFPGNLLLPPSLLLDLPPGTCSSLTRAELERRCARVLESARAPEPQAAARLYLAAWQDAPSFSSLVEGLARLLPDARVLETSVLWLGEHGEDEAGLDSRHWSGPGLGPGHSEDVTREETDAPEPRESRVLLEAVRRAITSDPARPRPHDSAGGDRSVVPFPGRREAWLLAAGIWPAFFPSQVRAPDEEERRVQVYVDVSGSTRALWPFLYGLVLHLADEIGEPIHAFSNAVREIGLGDLRAGVVESTGGTDFDCVAEHALARRYRRILVLTDGMAELDPALARRLRRERVEVFLVLTAPAPCPLRDLARGVWQVPECEVEKAARRRRQRRSAHGRRPRVNGR